MRVTANCQLNIVGNLHLDHGGLIVEDLLDSQEDLVDVFLGNLLAVLESLNHVVDKFLCHFIPKLGTIIVVFEEHGSNIQALGGRGLITNLDGGIEGKLPYNLLALLQLQPRIFIGRVKADTFLEIFDSLLRAQDGGSGKTSAVVSLVVARLAVRRVERAEWLHIP